MKFVSPKSKGFIAKSTDAMNDQSDLNGQTPPDNGPRTIDIVRRQLGERKRRFNPDTENNRSVTGELSTHIRSYATGSIFLARLENYNEIFQSFGYGTSRNLTAEVLSRVQSASRSSALAINTQGERENVVFHQGSEVTVILDNLSKSDVLESIRKRIDDALRAPIRIGKHTVPIRCLTGNASWPADGRDSGQLLDVATFTRRLTLDLRDTNRVGMEEARGAFEMEADLSGAIDRNELVRHSQPKCLPSKSATPVGVEALLRWHRKRRNWIRPDIFIPLAVESGSIIEIGR